MCKLGDMHTVIELCMAHRCGNLNAFGGDTLCVQLLFCVYKGVYAVICYLYSLVLVLR